MFSMVTYLYTEFLVLYSAYRCFLEARFPENPSSVFERLKLTNSTESVERNTQWLREQSSRSFNGMMATESVSDGSSLSLGETFEAQSPFDGDLALQQEDNGKFYYTYTSGSSSASAANDDFSIIDDENNGTADLQAPKLNWIASRSTIKQNRISRIKSTSYPSTSSSGRQSLSASSDFYPIPDDAEVPPEVAQFVHEHPQPPSKCTECSACRIRLDSFRYVCSTCGEKTPQTPTPLPLNGKGKARVEADADPFRDPYSYPPGYRTPRPTRPLPSLPPLHPTDSSAKSVSSNGSSSGSSGSTSSTMLAGGDTGYELCPSCFQTEAIVHCIEVSSIAAESEPSSPDSDYARSQRHRKAPQKGQFRHAFQEKVWSVDGWKDVGE